MESEIYKDGYYAGVQNTLENVIKIINSFAKDSDTDGRMCVFEFFDKDLDQLIERISSPKTYSVTKEDSE